MLNKLILKKEGYVEKKSANFLVGWQVFVRGGQIQIYNSPRSDSFNFMKIN